jgi:hypothetical protein
MNGNMTRLSVAIFFFFIFKIIIENNGMFGGRKGAASAAPWTPQRQIHFLDVFIWSTLST